MKKCHFIGSLKKWQHLSRNKWNNKLKIPNPELIHSI
jgi:hypothetical protein